MNALQAPAAALRQHLYCIYGFLYLRLPAMVVSASSVLGFKHNPIKILTRSRGAIAVCVCSILYLAWYLPSINVRHGWKSAWSAAPRRLIVFGDSWSDNGKYPIDSPQKRLLPVKEEVQGLVWTEWLCLAVGDDRLGGTSNRRMTDGKLDQMQPSRQLC